MNAKTETRKEDKTMKPNISSSVKVTCPQDFVVAVIQYPG